jgi:hypothetical protein
MRRVIALGWTSTYTGGSRVRTPNLFGLLLNTIIFYSILLLNIIIIYTIIFQTLPWTKQPNFFRSVLLYRGTRLGPGSSKAICSTPGWAPSSHKEPADESKLQPPATRSHSEVWSLVGPNWIWMWWIMILCQMQCIARVALKHTHKGLAKIA